MASYGSFGVLQRRRLAYKLNYHKKIAGGGLLDFVPF